MILSIGTISSDASTFVARRPIANGLFAYRTTRRNAGRLLATFAEVSQGQTYEVGDSVWYATQRGGLLRSVVTVVVYGASSDYSDQDYQIKILRNDAVIDTTGSRIIRRSTSPDEHCHTESVHDRT